MYSPSHSGGGHRGYGGGGGGASSPAASHHHGNDRSNHAAGNPNLPSSASGVSGGGKYVPRTPEGGRHQPREVTAIATNPLRASGGSHHHTHPHHITPTKKQSTVQELQPQGSQTTATVSGAAATTTTTVTQTWTGLDLSRMKLRAVSPAIAIYGFLTELYLQFNNLSVLPVEMFASLRNLRVLDLSYNAIVYLPPEIGHLLHLHTLLLINNSIRELPVETGKLFRLEKLAVEGNPLQDPPQDIIDKGAQSIVAYSRDRMPGTCCA